MQFSVADQECEHERRDLKYTAMLLSYICELDNYIRHGLFQEGAAMIDKNNAFFTKLDDKPTYRSRNPIIVYNIVYIYLGAGEYRKALKWINTLLAKDVGFNEMLDLQCFTHILNLIIHYELENEELLPHIIRSTYRFLYKKNQLFKVESVILSFIRKKFSKVSRHDKKGMSNVFREFRIALVKATQKESERMVLEEFFDIISWVDSKLEKKSFEEIVQRKAKTTFINKGRGSNNKM